MFSVVCQETKSKQFIVTVRASIAKVKLELTCSAFNDYLTLLPYNHTLNKGNNKITELRTILQRESQNS